MGKMSIETRMKIAESNRHRWEKYGGCPLEVRRKTGATVRRTVLEKKQKNLERVC